MKGFIELTYEDGYLVCININNISDFSEYSKGLSYIRVLAKGEYTIQVTQSYEEIKQLIRNAQ